MTAGADPVRVLLKRDGSFSQVDVDGSLLGVFDEETWPTQTVHLDSGDRMIFYTDGIELAFNQEGEIGGDRWKQRLMESANNDTKSILSEFVADIDQRSLNSDTKDDLTIVVVERS